MEKELRGGETGGIRPVRVEPAGADAPGGGGATRAVALGGDAPGADGQPLFPRAPTAKVPEATYLVADRVEHYRLIMRFFYEQHMAHRYYLRDGDVLHHVRTLHPVYTAEQCAQDLEQLVQWQSLHREYERARVRTVEEFRRRHALYQATEVAVRIERLLVELEEAGRRAGALESGGLASLWERLQELDRALAALQQAASPAGAAEVGAEGGGRIGTAVAAGARAAEAAVPQHAGRIHQLWVEVYGHFQRTDNNAKDFLAEMHRVRPEQINEADAYLRYKDALVNYLKGFSLALFSTGERIASLLEQWRRSGRDRVLAEVVLYHEQQTPAADGSTPRRDLLQARVRRECQGMVGWFERGGGMDTLRGATLDCIQLVTRQAARIIERRQTARSARGELDALAARFFACPTPAHAERLAALAFGATLPRHARGSTADFPEAERGPWSDPPLEIGLLPVHRGLQERVRSEAVGFSSEAKERLLQAALARRARGAERLAALFAAGDIDLNDCRIEDPTLRDDLLDLVGQCLQSSDRTAAAPDGSRVRLSGRALVWVPGRAGEAGDGGGLGRGADARSFGRLSAPDGDLLALPFRVRREVG